MEKAFQQKTRASWHRPFPQPQFPGPAVVRVVLPCPQACQGCSKCPWEETSQHLWGFIWGPSRSNEGKTCWIHICFLYSWCVGNRNHDFNYIESVTNGIVFKM